MRTQTTRGAIAICLALAFSTGRLDVFGGANQDEAASWKANPSLDSEKAKRPKKIIKSPSEWRRQLSRKQYYVTRERGTEPAFTGRYWRHKARGTYLCVCCDESLFHWSTKFKSGTGWPSFYKPIDEERITKRIDGSLFSVRTEVLCQRCDAHLGHVFPDGPRPTGLRYCLNSAALKFEPEKKKTEKKPAKKNAAEPKPKTANAERADS